MELTTSLAASGYLSARDAAKADPHSPKSNLTKMGEEFLTALNSGEEVAKSTMLGQSDPHSLVQALSATELAVETAVTLRDKVVEAYQEILRMPV